MYNDGLDLNTTLDKMWKHRGPIPGMRASHLYPSSASVKVFNKNTGKDEVIGGCLRKQFLHFNQESVSDPGFYIDSIGPAEIGNLVQDYIEDKFKLSGVFIQSELSIYLAKFNVSGRVDTILGHFNELSQSIEYYGVEIKSKDGYYNQGKYVNPLRSANPVEFRPADEHLLQSMVYQDAFNTVPTLMPYNMKKWMVLYVMRGTGDYNHFEMELTKENSKSGYGYPILYSKIKPDGFIYKKFSINDIHKRWEELNFCIKNDILPDRDFIDAYSPLELQTMNNQGLLNKTNSEKVAKGQFGKITMKVNGVDEALGDFACKYCNYRSKCWGLNNNPIEKFDCISTTKSFNTNDYSLFDPLNSKYKNKLTLKQINDITEDKNTQGQKINP